MISQFVPKRCFSRLRHPLPSTSYIVLMVLVSVVLGVPIHATFVQGDYEWLGLLQILRDVSHRRGFWALCLVVWGLGMRHAEAGYTVFSRPRGALLSWAGASIALFALLQLVPKVVRSGHPIDEIACAVLIPGLALHLMATPGSYKQRAVRAGTTLGAAFLTFIACTLVAFGYTMFKGMLFSLFAPTDAWLMRLDEAILGHHFYENLVPWRRFHHPSFTRWLDGVYVGLFEAQWWTFLFFFGSRDHVAGRRYILATFSCYLIGCACYYLAPSLGPVFYRPELFADCRHLAPGSTFLVYLLAENTRITQSGVAHPIAPFGFIAAFPSLHVSLALIVMFAMRRSLAMTIFNGLGVAFTIVATVILGWHYLVDGLFGLGLGAFCWWFAVHSTNRDAQRRA